MNNNTIPSTGFRFAFRFALGVSMAGQLITLPAVFAQQTNEPTKLKPVVVTGSNIPTVETEGPSPVVRITREDIERTGASTVSEVLRKLPQNNAGSFDDKFVNSFAPGSSGISLRGLGQNATLVLLNGRRVATYGFAQNITDAFVDLNSLPLAAIERIEVLKDGASAIYGSDAIAGVVNIILRKSFSGVEVTAKVGNTTDRDAMEQTYSLVGGTSNDKSSALIIADYYKRNALFLRDREISQSADHRGQGGVDLRSSSGNPGSIRIFPGSTNGYASGFFRVPVDSTGSPTAAEILANPGLNRFDFNPLITAIPETTRYGALGIFNHQIFDNLSMFVETSFRRVRTETDSAPTPIFGDVDGFTVPYNNPFNPFGEDVTFRYRVTEAGPRHDVIDTDAVRLLPGLRLTLGDSWEIETAFLYNENRTLIKGNNFLSVNALRTALESTDPATALNVFGAGRGINSESTIDSLKVKTFREGRSEIMQQDIKASGQLVQMPAGPLGLAAGGEWRREIVEDVSDSLSEGGNIVSSGGTSSAGRRDAYAAYLELGVPVFSSANAVPGLYGLDFQLAGRFENYSDFGNTAKPKLGVKWQPVKSLLLRASWGQGFRAPSLVQLFSGQTTSFDFLSDPARGDNDLQYRIVAGGNPKLDPEESESYNFGVVYEPEFAKGLSLSVDVFRITQNGVIDRVDAQFILDNEGLFPGLVTRLPPTAQDTAAGIPGAIVSINSTYQNLAKRRVDGIDFGARYDLPTGIGDFTLDGNLAYIHRWKEQPQPGSEYVDRHGSYHFPQWRANSSLFWKWEKFGAGVSVNYIGSYDQSNQIQFTEVNSWTTVDLQASYELPYNSKVTVGVLNVADKAPPFSDSSDATEGYDIETHDPRGRFVYVSLTKKF